MVVSRQEKNRKRITKRHQNIIRKGREWLSQGHSAEVVAEGLWNKMAANTLVKNGKVQIWGKFNDETKMRLIEEL